MNGESLSYTAQWIGLVGTLVGTALGVGSVVLAWIAASRAKGAREAAEAARQAAIRLGRIAQLGDLIADMQELQTMLAREDLAAIPGKANLLRGRVARLKSEGYTELMPEEQENLDLARGRLEVIGRVATGKATPREIAQIQRSYGDAYEALNRVFALHAQSAKGA